MWTENHKLFTKLANFLVVKGNVYFIYVHLQVYTNYTGHTDKLVHCLFLRCTFLGLHLYIGY